MDDVSNILTRSHADTHLQAYLLKRLCRQSPQTVLANVEEFVPVLAGFDAEATGEVLDELVRQDLPDVPRFLLHVLSGDPRWFVQIRAIGHLVARAKESRIMPALIHLLGTSPHARVKARVLTALARVKLDIPLRVIKPFLTHADARIRASALEALLTRDLTGMSDILTLLLNDTSPRVKALAAVGLWRLGNSVLLELLGDAEDPEHRVAYIYALGLTGRDAQTRGLLLRALACPHAAQRLMACRSLRNVAEADDVPSLLETAVDLTGRDTRQALVLTCDAIDHAMTLSTLHSMVTAGEKGRNPRRVASLLAMFAAFRRGQGDGRGADGPWLAWMPEARPSLSPERIAAAASPCDSKAATLSEDGPRQPDASCESSRPLRPQGMVAAGPVDFEPSAHRDAEPDIEYLSRFLESPDGRVRANAVEALAPYCGLGSIQEALLRCWGSEVARVRVNAALPLWRAGYQFVMSGLKDMLSSSVPAVRASAAWALGQVGGFVATSYLRKALDDPDESTRKLAFEGLNQQV